MNYLQAHKRLGLILLGVIVTAISVLLLAPQEATLGDGIRSVYVHVGLIWAGMAGFAVAAIIGALILWQPRVVWLSWLESVGWVSFGFYAAGVLTSMIASWDNWGAVFIQEPRMAAAVNSLAIAVILQIVSSWSPWPRLRGVLQIALILVILWMTYTAPKVLHPTNPIWSSDSWGIQLTFVGLFFLFAGTAIYLAWHLRRRGSGSDNQSSGDHSPA